ncbi:succinate dehydrogenase cytochrome b subunit [Fulvivirgaceae bacterium BMA10]|uniref:Succinate dehydrogenase cytochrome b subunit n=1 Tax=Splendidivirga corallicola TaxID=3051826 RepID=A0ABT8KS08_9BACT|nr:succinate dehydrogenase cytochrome b subunit [Fulvivirgaceae bacterium BMA10]
MSWLIDSLTSSLGRKVLMALTGLFLILFLAVHLSGNLQLLKGDEGRQFNIYAEFMTSNPLIKVISIGNFFFILLHIVTSVILNRRNKKARPVGYAVSPTQSTWASRNMGVLGFLILIFLIIHLKGFWYEMKFGSVETTDYDAKDLYAVVKAAYSQLWYVAIYVVSMAVLAFHLSHGFQSAFQTFGLNHIKYSPIIKFVGAAFAIVVPALFALIPIWMFLNS